MIEIIESVRCPGAGYVKIMEYLVKHEAHEKKWKENRKILKGM